MRAINLVHLLLLLNIGCAGFSAFGTGGGGATRTNKEHFEQNAQNNRDKRYVRELKHDNSTSFNESFLIKQRMVESSNNMNAVSPKGAIGIAQFMPSTWNWLKDTGKIPYTFNIGNRAHQIQAQETYLLYLYNRPWDERIDKYKATIASYNCGRGRVLTLIRKHGCDWDYYLPQETKNYLIKLDV